MCKVIFNYTDGKNKEYSDKDYDFADCKSIEIKNICSMENVEEFLNSVESYIKFNVQKPFNIILEQEDSIKYAMLKRKVKKLNQKIALNYIIKECALLQLNADLALQDLTQTIKRMRNA